MATSSSRQTYEFSARRLAASEAVSHVMHSRRDGHGTRAHVSLFRCPMHIPDDLLFQAVMKIANFQSMLRMKISETTQRKEGSGQCTMRFSEIDRFKAHIHIERDAERLRWTEYVQQELSIPFNTDTGPLWKLALIQFDPDDYSDGSSTLDSRASGVSSPSHSAAPRGLVHYAMVLKAHPSISDTTSMFHVITKQILFILNKLLLGGSIEDITEFDGRLSLTASVDDSFLDGSETLSKRQKKAVKNSILKTTPSYVAPRVRTEFRQPIQTNLKTRILPFSLSTELSMHLLDKCQRYDVSLKSFILATSSLIIGILANKGNTKNIEDIVCGFPIHLRKFHSMGSPHMPMGAWEGVANIQIPTYLDMIQADVFWKLAQKIQSRMAKSVSKRPWSSLCTCREIAARLGPDTPLPAAIVNAMHAGSTPHFECDALIVPQGTEVGPAGGEALIRVDEHYFTSSLAGGEVALLVTASLLRRRLALGVTWHAGWVSEVSARQLAQLLHTTIADMVSPQMPPLSTTLKMPPALRRHYMRTATPRPQPGQYVYQIPLQAPSRGGVSTRTTTDGRTDDLEQDMDYRQFHGARETTSITYPLAKGDIVVYTPLKDDKVVRPNNGSVVSQPPVTNGDIVIHTPLRSASPASSSRSAGSTLQSERSNPSSASTAVRKGGVVIDTLTMKIYHTDEVLNSSSADSDRTYDVSVASEQESVGTGQTGSVTSDQGSVNGHEAVINAAFQSIHALDGPQGSQNGDGSSVSGGYHPEPGCSYSNELYGVFNNENDKLSNSSSLSQHHKTGLSSNIADSDLSSSLHRDSDSVAADIPSERNGFAVTTISLGALDLHESDHGGGSSPPESGKSKKKKKTVQIGGSSMIDD